MAKHPQGASRPEKTLLISPLSITMSYHSFMSIYSLIVSFRNLSKLISNGAI